MNRKPVRSYRLSPHTITQLDALAAHMGTNLSETLTVAIDRMAQQELQEDSTMERSQYTQDDIVDYTGADNWQMVVNEFRGKDLSQVRRTLDEMYHTEDNEALAEAIVKQANK